jgi:hypothetical protein
MNSFRIWKKTGTHADIFAAVGLAHVLSSIPASSRISDAGPFFEIRVIPDVNEISFQGIGTDAGYLYLQAKPSDSVPSGVLASQVLDRQGETERAKRFQNASKEAKLAGVAMSEEARADKPRNDLRLYQVLNTLQGDGGTNKALQRILRESPEAWGRTLFQALQSLHDDAPDNSGLEADLVQLFNPQAAKGYARLKPDSTDRNDQTKNNWAEPLVEWLRYRGYFQVACPISLGQKREHIRLLCPIPHSIGFRLLGSVAAELRGMPIYGSASKIDCLGTLAIAQILIARSPEFQEDLIAPAQLVSGVSIVHYQSMGKQPSQKAVTSIEQLALPDWFVLQSTADAELWIKTLGEHFAILRRLEDKNSDELGMLQQYRRYLEQRGSGATLHLLTFMESYGIFVLRKRGQNQWRHRQFLVSHVEAILNHQVVYREILNSPGFKAIAAALRSATVSAQVLKRNKQDYRDIRYDILPELRRKRTLPTAGPFIEALSDFVAAYNAESAKRRELNKRSGTKRVTTEELQSFISLLDAQKDASVIGAMLCAYATCREVQEAEVPDAGDDNPTETEEPNGEA